MAQSEDELATALNRAKADLEGQVAASLAEARRAAAEAAELQAQELRDAAAGASRDTGSRAATAKAETAELRAALGTLAERIGELEAGEATKLMLGRAGEMEALSSECVRMNEKVEAMSEQLKELQVLAPEVDGLSARLNEELKAVAREGVLSVRMDTLSAQQGLATEKLDGLEALSLRVEAIAHVIEALTRRQEELQARSAPGGLEALARCVEGMSARLGQLEVARPADPLGNQTEVGETHLVMALDARPAPPACGPSQSPKPAEAREPGSPVLSGGQGAAIGSPVLKMGIDISNPSQQPETLAQPPPQESTAPSPDPGIVDTPGVAMRLATALQAVQLLRETNLSLREENVELAEEILLQDSVGPTDGPPIVRAPHPGAATAAETPAPFGAETRPVHRPHAAPRPAVVLGTRNIGLVGQQAAAAAGGHGGSSSVLAGTMPAGPVGMPSAHSSAPVHGTTSTPRLVANPSAGTLAASRPVGVMPAVVADTVAAAPCVFRLQSTPARPPDSPMMLSSRIPTPGALMAHPRTTSTTRAASSTRATSPDAAAHARAQAQTPIHVAPAMRVQALPSHRMSLPPQSSQ